MSKPLSDDNPDVVRVRNTVKELGEHYDAVQVFVSRHEEGEHQGTINVHIGAGNWFARYGQVREWIVKQDEFTRLKARKDEGEP